MIYKRAQVPLLILALAALLLAYVYFLPLSEKCKIVNLPECRILGEKVLSVFPGLIETEMDLIEYSLPDVELFTVSGTERNVLADNMDVRRGWFYTESPKLSFSIHEKSKDVLFYVYLIDDHKIKVKVNGEKITTIRGVGQHTFVVPSKKLKTDNNIQLIPSIPFFPFSLNTVRIGGVLYEEAYTLTQEKVTVPFSINEDMKDIKEANLSFRSDCFGGENNLSVVLNNTEITNSLICRSFSKNVKNMLKTNNNLSFFSKGNYFIYDIILSIRLQQDVWPTYYFDVIEKRDFHQMTIRFNETDKEEKKLTVYLNGKSISVETSDDVWQTDVAAYLYEWQNKLIIIPAKTVDIDSFDIY
jgi:hypothetical protein